MLLKILGIFKEIPGNFIKDSRECSGRLRQMILKIPGNALGDSGECSKRFLEML